MFGPRLTESGTTFRLWAPGAHSVDLMLDQPMAMQGTEDGWFSVHAQHARDGMKYKFRIDGDMEVPDPASAYQPDDVFGASEIVDHASFAWRCSEWRGRPWTDAVFLETHVGTFTPEGTYRAMIDKLDHLVETGITAIELMPLADFAGNRNWGYDGVLWYAPDSAYGTPDDLKTLIDEAHMRDLMVFLDVVYNHFGPEGNFIGRYAPGFFCDAQTPWGNAIDYRIPQVRAFAIENALHWLRDYRFDGLRLDAVHAIVEPGHISVLDELSRAVGAFATQSGRHLHLVLENDDNIASLLNPEIDPPAGKYRAQWNDDYHHAWHVLLSGERHGYYMDYADAPARQIATMLRAGFAYQGEPSPHRSGLNRGEDSSALPPTAFVNFLQNHDQIGNRPLGDRLELSADAKAIEAALAITLLAPMPPMLFMGEEWGAKTPFPFFCDFHGELAQAIRNGRRKEFAGAYESYGDEIPDPLDSTTFVSAKLDWTTRDEPTGRARHALVTSLLTVRRSEIVPHLHGASFQESATHEDGRVLAASWMMGDGRTLDLLANLSDQTMTHHERYANARSIFGGRPPEKLTPWSVYWMRGTA